MIKYFEIMQNRKVIDLLHYDEEVGPTYVRFQKAHGIPLRCSAKNAEGFMSDNERFYSTSDLIECSIPDLYPQVSLFEVSEVEFEIIKDRRFKTVDEIREEFMLEILERGI